ncbi:MAG: anti-sigma factor [Burkholderiales bacterium]|nr:anti-sigma factor [Burkholderiales bacterium]
MSISEHDLQAYVDGQIDPARVAEIETHLADNPQDAMRVEAYRKQNQTLHALFDPTLDEPLSGALQRRHRPRPQWQRYAAMVGILALGLVLGFGLRGVTAPALGPMALSKQAAFAHVAFVPEVLHPVEVSAKQEAHLVNWLSKRLGGDVRAPHLSSAGFDLMGGRLLPGEAGPAAQFMYQDHRGQRLTLYVKREQARASETAFRFAKENGVSVFYWIDRDFGYALSGDLPKGDLLKVAETVYRQLNP